jgi:hypothetical protein
VYEFRFSRRSPKLPSYLSAPLFSDCGAKRRPLSAAPAMTNATAVVF